MTPSEQAAQIASEVDAACTGLEQVYDKPVARLETFTASVVPAEQWGSFTEDGYYCEPDLFWEVIIIAAQTDWHASMDWLYARVDELRRSTDVRVASWSQPELISLGSSGEGIAVRVQLHPRTLED